MKDNTRGNKPRPRKRGGAMFPRITLEEALHYADTLRHVTHARPQARDVVYPAVFNANSWLGSVRASALKQYGFMEGNARGYLATGLTRQIFSAGDSQTRISLLRRACLNPKVFRVFGRILAEANQGDESAECRVPLDVLSREILKENVHPDSLEECIGIYVASLEFVGLAKRDADAIVVNASDEYPRETRAKYADVPPRNGDGERLQSASPATDHHPDKAFASPPPKEETSNEYDLRPGFTVNLNIRLNGIPSVAELEQLMQTLRKSGLLKPKDE